ncbi:hypothetical protein G5V57_18850 [Nordella sp. HKS 07]|uniref:hypothetical protein n=1 Tax=Nordella sp. HKS 07 TaxID=2712222 RepID=UPI0013E1B62A|nr:hypothetical protein [Nordella sp. HKS 07]QIG49586.1 hypothetical protein G5V57_18850 [Nordella sp. HKS 07]
MSAGVSQMSTGWDRLLAYYDQTPVVVPGVVTDESQIAPLIPKLVDASIGLLNSPYPETRTDHSRLTERVAECETPRANLNETVFFLRANLFEPLAPIAIHHPRDAKLPAELATFFQDYGGAAHSLTTNARGERTTLPILDSPRKVLVTGDSAAFGTLVDDARTLPSRLQARDLARQYVNLGIPDASAQQILCNLTEATSRYRGQVDEIVYFFSEDDFAPTERFGSANEAVAAIRELVQKESITKVTLVYLPTLYNIVPELTRYRGYAGERAPNPQGDRELLKKLVLEAGFKWLDMGEIAMERARAQSSSFAVFVNFADPKNLSAQGIDNLVENFTPPVQPLVPTSLPTATNVEDQSIAEAGLEAQFRKQSAALDDIRAATARAAKNNRLKREIGDILRTLKEELAAGP